MKRIKKITEYFDEMEDDNGFLIVVGRILRRVIHVLNVMAVLQKNIETIKKLAYGRAIFVISGEWLTIKRRSIMGGNMGYCRFQNTVIDFA